MTSVRLPPRYYNTLTAARFRKHKLPAPEWETWELINALSWVNDYKFTPPISLRDLKSFLPDIQVRALATRLAHLKAWGWLRVQSDDGRANVNSGRPNVYVPIVPEDTPDSCGGATSRRELDAPETKDVRDGAPFTASLIHLRGEDSSEDRSNDVDVDAEGAGDAILSKIADLQSPTGDPAIPSGSATHAVDCIGSTSTSSSIPLIKKKEKETSTTAPMQFDDLDAVEIWEQALTELQLQMSKATFDAWLRSTRALRFEDHKLTVLAPSSYAQEWLVHRLDATVQRTLAGIVGEHVAVEYVLNHQPKEDIHER